MDRNVLCCLLERYERNMTHTKTDEISATTTGGPARVQYEGSRFEALVDQAYTRWQRLECDRHTWLLHLDMSERNAAVLAGYIAQVNNGGHQQWLGNGYHAADRVFLDFALDRLGEHDQDAVEQAKRLIHEAGLQEDLIVNSCDEDDWERAAADLDVWDDQFYDTELADRLTAAAESYLGATSDASASTLTGPPEGSPSTGAEQPEVRRGR